MRIVAGQFGGRKLNTPKNDAIRPTSDKVRGAIFNSLNSRGVIQGARVLDCFCGTGALGLEALSRGAIYCTFLDSNKTSLAIAQSNAALLGLKNEVEFILKDAIKFSPSSEEKIYDLVFLDPPYRQDLIEKTLTHLEHCAVLAPSCILVIEAEKTMHNDFLKTFRLLDEKIYKDTKIIYLEYRP